MSLIVDTSLSPHARLRPVPLGSVRLLDDFWEPRRRVNQEVTLPSQYQRCEETGRIDNFRRAAGKKEVPFQGRYYNDSDVYKWVEAAAFALAGGPDPALEGLLDQVVREIADAQKSDGYLNTYFTFERQDQRWTNLRDLHELYCAGHLIQAAIACSRCAGRDDLLGVARRYADCICDVFGPDGRNGTCGHQEIEMALVELARHTGEDRYRQQARLFLERRGQVPPVIGGSPYHQDHAPFRELGEVVGHAVRMVYYCCGAADLCADTGDSEYLAALERLWRSMVLRRMYVTGGIGSRYEGEAFGEDFELPNERAYAELCAAIGSVMWNWRMLQLTGEARFADLIEATLYNAMLPSLSLDGELYFYQNPLADGGKHRRQPWFECACCPPNIARMLASLPAYFYSVSDEGLWVHLYAAGEVAAEVAGGTLRLRQRTRYPWDGEVELTVEAAGEGPCSLFLRIPAWARGASAVINGTASVGSVTPGSYLEIRMDWEAGDVVRLSLPMSAARIHAHPYVANNSGHVALCRGPLIYCVEQVDLDGADPRDLVLPASADLREIWERDLLGGVMTLDGQGLLDWSAAAWGRSLYRDRDPASPEPTPIAFRAVPYYAWGNREAGGMAVWLRAMGS